MSGVLNMSEVDSLITTKMGSNVAPEKPEQKETFVKTLISDIFSYNPANPFIFTSPAFWIFFLLYLRVTVWSTESW